MIRVEALSKSYGNTSVFNNLNLEFREGEVVGIIGENGAGKTTLFKCIAGLESYRGVVDYDRGILRDKTGFMEANPFFFTKMTGMEYLRLVCQARQVPMGNPEQYNFFELPLDKYATEYSTGMQKKLAFTGILLQQNEVFVLDEPFNGVDIHSNLILEEMIRMLKAKYKIVILSSHIFSTLRDTCDYLLHLKDGGIAQRIVRADFDKVEAEMKGTMFSQTMYDRLDELL